MNYLTRTGQPKLHAECEVLCQDNDTGEWDWEPVTIVGKGNLIGGGYALSVEFSDGSRSPFTPLAAVQIRERSCQ